MKKSAVFLIILAGVLTVACNKLKITAFPEIKIAGEGSYYISDMKVVSGNRGPISIKGDKIKDQQFIYITGSYKDTEGTTRCLVAKFSDNGRPVWFKLYPEVCNGYGQPRVSEGLSLQVSTDAVLKDEGVYVMAGEFDRTNYRMGKIVLLKYDSVGHLLFKHAVIDSGLFRNGSLQMDNTGNLYCCGLISSHGDQILLYKTNASGDLIWSKTYPYPKRRPPMEDEMFGPPMAKFQALYKDRLVCSGLLEDRKDLFYMTFDSLGNADELVVCATPEAEGSLVDVKIDANRSVYFVCKCGNCFEVLVYDRANKLRWRVNNKDSLSHYNSANAFAIDDMGGVYVSGINQNGLMLTKYDSTGAVQWQKTNIIRFPEGPPTTWGRGWYITPDYIREGYECNSLAQICVIDATADGIILRLYNTAGLMKSRALYKIKTFYKIDAVDGQWLAVNVGEQARLVKYEEFAIYGINRWD